MRSRPHPNLTRLRIQKLSDRTEATVIPKLDGAFSLQPLDADLCRSVIDTMTFSEYPGAKEDGARALSAFMGNSSNFQDLSQFGSLGAVLEQLRSLTNSHADEDSKHIKILVESLHRMCITDDKLILDKLISNPHGISIILKLCLTTHGTIQEQVTQILIAISKLEHGIAGLVRHNVMETLMTPEMLYRSTTSVEVRHSATNLIYRIATLIPSSYPLQKFLDMALDEQGKRRIDPYQEIQFLQGLICHWTALANESLTLPVVFTYFKYLLYEMEFELFDNLDHCVIIVKCLVLGSKDVAQVDYMLKHDLAVALQYLVRTDFTLYRKHGEGVTDSNMKVAIRELRKKTKKLSFQDSGNRSDATLMALTIINPQNKKGNNKATEETNIFATKSVVTIYENILEYRTEIISDIISSGLLPALIYKVGFGTEKDFRYMKIAVQFVYSIVTKVISTTPCAGIHVSLLPLPIPRSVPYVPIGEIDPLSPSSLQAHQISHPVEVRSKVNSTDVRLISNTFHVQGITDILLVAAAYTDDTIVVQKALVCLAILEFQVIKVPLFETVNMHRIFSHCVSRLEWHYPALSLIFQLMSSPSATDEQLTLMTTELKGLKLIIAAMRMSTWEFPFKGVIYDCMVAICHIPHFRTKIAELGGLSILLTSVYLRRNRHRAKRRARLTTTHDEATEKIYVVLRRDINALRIQCLARARKAWIRVQAIRSSRGIVYKSKLATTSGRVIAALTTVNTIKSTIKSAEGQS